MCAYVDLQDIYFIACFYGTYEKIACVDTTDFFRGSEFFKYTFVFYAKERIWAFLVLLSISNVLQDALGIFVFKMGKCSWESKGNRAFCSNFRSSYFSLGDQMLSLLI